MHRRTLCWMRGSRFLSALIWVSSSLLSTMAFAQSDARVDANALLISTDSPRDTLKTFVRLADEWEKAIGTYSQNPSRENADRVRELEPFFLQLLDLSPVPSAARAVLGGRTSVDLLDIFGRVDLPPLDSVPDTASLDETPTTAKWRIPGTPIRMVRIMDGPREGEFLFSARTITVAPAFFERIRHLPLRTSLDIVSWNTALPQLHGPMIPDGLVAALPDSFKNAWFDTPIWKIVATVISMAAAITLLVMWHRLITRYSLSNMIAIQIQRALTPLATILIVSLLRPFFTYEVNVSGQFAIAVDFATTLVVYMAAVWIFWLIVILLFEAIINSPKISEESLDANLLRLSARIIGFIGIAFILAVGAHELGLPVLGLVAGLGVGGLAVALAIRPTLENLIGGVILFVDKPVRVGDFCRFGDHMGTVEHIGVRSTKIRALDRTLISIPNATFADMEIVNWAQCDRMLIERTIGVRYETKPDQLRYVLAKLREMFYAHPKIDRDTVRVRFDGHGASSLDIQIRVYALTREWNEFHAIKEDVLLRVDEIIEEAGSGFAFPSRTVYMGQDLGLDQQLREAALDQVTSWRQANQLPFPQPAPERIDDLAGTLDYPPYGSPGAASPQVQPEETTEPLSADEQTGHTEEANKKN